MGLVAEIEFVSRPQALQAPQAPRSFRPDIQALRAIAVVSVVLYHLFPLRLTGGFVGVDIFFVISGFLITKHLVGEITRTGRISLTQFWARRIRRLLPAAFTVLAVSVALLVLCMPVVTWHNNMQEIGAAAAYVENWLLGIHAVDYLAAENSASLVQHYWWLSVEEQFYLVWPLLLLLAMAAARIAGRMSPRTAVRWTLGFVAVGSFAVSVVLTSARPPLAFFVTPTRAWEFAIGGLLSVAPSLSLGAREPALRAVTSWLGITLIAYSVYFIGSDSPFPGTIALLPVLGAALMLAGGTSSARWSPTPLTGLQPVQWLGNYSYSLYLWHWPLIIVSPWLLHGPTTWHSKLVILAASLVLAYLTKRYVEDPIRTGRRWLVRRWPSYTFAAAGMVVFLVVATISNGQIADRNDASAATALASVEKHLPCYGAPAILDAGRCPRPFARPDGLNTAFAAADTGSESCQQHKTVPTLKLCTFGQQVAPAKTVVLVGNSHALRLMPALDLYGREHGWKIVLASKTDCLGLISTPVGSQTSGDSCLAWSGELQKTLLTMPDLDGVIFASHANAQAFLAGSDASPGDLATADQRIVAAWTALRGRGVPVLVTEDVPGMRPDAGPECVARTAAAYDPCAKDRSSVPAHNLLDTLAQRHPELAKYLPLNQYFCDATTCHALVGGVVVYSDAHHLTGTYSRSMSEPLGAEVAAAMRVTRSTGGT
jgi:peptidoglycan/LPS O-acetylase OafA/YrhL